jgi:mannose-6-phosphate isomerase
MSLYPLKFKTIYKETIWGGNKLKNQLNKDVPATAKVGETWEISCVEGDISVVSNGLLEGNSLQDLIEIYMGDLVGDKVYDKYGLEFPVLIKFIDANDDLSIQVHPDDATAKERHNAFGKTEMWYVLEAEKGSKLISGFNKTVTKREYLDKLETNEISDILNFEEVKKGDVFFIPAGRVHAIGSGILLAEIQHTSDITYRIYDWDRKDKNGNGRELHTDLALDVLDFKKHDNYKTEYKTEENEAVELANTKYFTTNIIELTKKMEIDIFKIDSFIIYIATEGETEIIYSTKDSISIKKGETVLIPAELNNIILNPKNKNCTLLEVYM